MSMGDKDKIGGQIITITGIGIHIDHLSFTCDDAEAPVSLIKKLMAIGQIIRRQSEKGSRR